MPTKPNTDPVFSSGGPWLFIVPVGLMLFCTSCGGQTTEAPVRPGTSGPYLVVSLVEPASEFYPAAELLAQRHSARIANAAPADLESLLNELRNSAPEHVAIVVHPEDLDVNLVNRIFKLSTEVDADPFVDFAWGVITGRDGAAAKKLVLASEPGADRPSPSISMFGVGGAGLQKSMTQKAQWPLRKGQLEVTSYLAKGESDHDRDTSYISESMPALGQSSIVLLASHGYPDGLVAGPKASDLRQVDLAGCVLFNIACYTGVTKNWYDEDHREMKVRKNSIDLKDSFCLQAIDCGVAGYFAYTCPRPAGPTMMGDAILLSTTGDSLGELFREGLQSVVMAHLLNGDSQVNISHLAEGTSLGADRTPGSAVRQMSTGGVLFGDPAFRPFPPMADADPRVLKWNEQGNPVAAEVRIESPLFHFFASDQINYWEDYHPALRLECRLPIGKSRIEKVDVISVPEAADDYRWVAAIEHSSNERFLRWKLNFRQPVDMSRLQMAATRGLSSQIEVHLSNGELADDKIIRGSGPGKENGRK